MITEAVYNKLIERTEEEKNILRGKIEVDKGLYTDERQFVIDCGKFLPKGEHFKT